MQDPRANASMLAADASHDATDDLFGPTTTGSRAADADPTAEAHEWAFDPAADRFATRVEDELRPLLDSLDRLRSRGLLD